MGSQRDQEENLPQHRPLFLDSTVTISQSLSVIEPGRNRSKHRPLFLDSTITISEPLFSDIN